MSDQRILELIQNGKDSRALAKLYKNYHAVKKYVNSTGGTDDDAEDIFQDALLMFINKVKEPDFQLSSTISTFVYGICKNLNKERIKSKSKQKKEETEPEEDNQTKGIEEFLHEEDQFEAVDKALIKIDKKCMDILTMFYYQKLSMKVIAEKLDFSGTASAKTQKYKCLDKARKLIANMIDQVKTK